jgi:glycosyltransferase involved in cell wall biosynthesis
MKVVFLVTHKPGKICGVADYTDKLADSMASSGIDVRVEKISDWSLRTVFQIRQKYADRKKKIFHLQYPALGMGYAIWPGLAPLLFGPKNTFLTLHEFSIFNVLRKAIFLPFGLLSKIIFTNDYERAFFHRCLSVSQKNTTVIPIGNNITPVLAEGVREPKVVYFGQLTEGKGIEEFIETAKILHASGSVLKFVIAGYIVDENSQIIKDVHRAVQDLGVELYTGLSSDDVSRLLQTATIAFLPFPDGISEKRGSALACMKHGLVMVTRHSEKTPRWLRETTYPITSKKEAADLIADLSKQSSTQQLAPDLLARELGLRDWNNIAKRHMELYTSG